MKIRVWKGYHSPKLLELLKETWEQDNLLILCPPTLRDFSFLEILRPGIPEFCGEWEVPASLSRSSAPEPHQTHLFGDHNPNLSKPVLGVFTSGTISGHPRLVFYSKQNIESTLGAITALFDLKRVEEIFCYPQPFHTFGLILGYMMSLYLKCTLVTPDGKYGRTSHSRRLELSNPKLLTLGTPTHFFDLNEYVNQTGGVVLPSYSCIIGGATVSVDLWNKTQKQLKIEAPSIGYGCTEASPGITHLPPGHKPTESGEVGFPLSSLNAEPRGSEGVKISGPAVCYGIYEKGQLTFPKELSIRDNIRVREDGNWIYTGRTDLVLNRGGEKVSLMLIEQSILDSLGLQIVCAALPDPRLGQDLGIVAVGAKNGATELEKLQAFLLTQFRIKLNPKHFFAVASLPLNESSKLDRSAIQNLFADPKPVPVGELVQWIPHRSPMVWIDEVIRFDVSGGECQLTLDSNAHYMSRHRLRTSSLIEFMAQAYAFISVCNVKAAPLAELKSLNEAFLVSIRDAEFSNRLSQAGTRLRVVISEVRPVGPITLFKGVVETMDGNRLAGAQLRVYST